MARATLKEVEVKMDDLLCHWGYELVRFRFVPRGRNSMLSLIIDQPGGVTLDDCETVHRRLGDFLDAMDPIPGSYVLEVSSPGLDRLLTKDEHFARHVGSEVKVKLSEKFAGSRHFRGILGAWGPTQLHLEREGEVTALPRHLVDEVRLVYHWDDES